MVREATSGTIALRSHIESAKDYISIYDVVDLLTQISLKGQKKIYNIASGRQTTHEEIYQMINLFYPCQLIHSSETPKFTFPPINIDDLEDEFQFKASGIQNVIQELIQSIKSREG